MSDLPEDIRRAVITEVYRQADDMDWDALTDRQHTTIYDRWLDDPDIGGKLTRFITRERARVWLKDVPMKEYARARYGIGPYAALASSRFPDAGRIARQVLGSGWDAVDGTIAEKPNRCVVSNGNEERLMMWGPPKTLRDIVWAGINARADGDPTPILVVAIQHGHMLNDGEKRRHAQLAGYAGLEVKHAVLRATRVTPADSATRHTRDLPNAPRGRFMYGLPAGLTTPASKSCASRYQRVRNSAPNYGVRPGLSPRHHQALTRPGRQPEATRLPEGSGLRARPIGER